jgi:hypothetical protein
MEQIGSSLPDGSKYEHAPLFEHTVPARKKEREGGRRREGESELARERERKEERDIE